MIFVRDKGRMCNNILQYGHLYAWGREHGRATMSMRFAYKYRYFHICNTPHHNFLTYVVAKYAAKWRLIPTVSFDEEGADTRAAEQLMLNRRLIVAQGWYARWYDLFLKYKSEIVALFSFNADVEQRVAARMAPKADAGAVSVGLHVRRGDYATFKDGRYFYTDQQYADMLSQFVALQHGRRVHIYICGNDPHLDRDLFRRQFPDVAFPDGTPGEDLCLLSHCDFLMGPPSTFTLVAAMYRDTPLCWIHSADMQLAATDFKHFDYLFRHIV